ncbi:MAG TPA: hypothetical protein VNE59_03335 [Burkholderiales bacterium]|nr:hypothetical protein [Burkholderiales bacterium]
MTNGVMAGLCASALAYGLSGGVAAGAPGAGVPKVQCAASGAQPGGRAARMPSRADAHVASLVVAHELTVIELGGSGFAPLHMGDRAALRQQQSRETASAVPVSNSNRGCKS